MRYPPIFVVTFSSLLLPLRNGTPLALVLFVIYFGLFLLPGFAVAGLIFRRNESSPLLAVIVTVLASSTLGFLAFWVFFFSKAVGRSFCFSVYIASALVVLTLSRRRETLNRLFSAVRSPVLWTVGAGLLYTAMFFLPSRSVASDPGLPSSRFFAEGRPGDNLIPLFLADRLYDQRPIRPFCCGGWLSSDRPPLQSGVFLLERPLRVLGGNWLHYQLLATGLQSLWVCGIWSVLVSLGASVRRRRQVLLFLIFSGFLFYNSVYTWPKLFASAFTLFIMAILVDIIREQRRATTVELCAGSCSLGLALLAHPGTVFSLPAFAALAVRGRSLVSVRQVALAASIVLCFVLPWIGYQRWVDPPGDRLLKMHLAGEADPTPRSTWRVIRDAYRDHSAGEIFRFKLSNLALLFGRSPFDLIGLDVVRLRPQPHVDHANAERSRINQGQYIWNALGVLNFGWIVVLVSALHRSYRSAVPLGAWLVMAGLLNLTIWSLVMFGPEATVTTHSSYADILLLSVGLLGWILTLPRYAVVFVFALQAGNLLVVWAWPR